MQPTTGETSETGLFGLANKCSQERIYTTFVGIGQDFGSELTQHITTNLRGSQYMTILSAKEFEELMSENFDYSVFPIVFDFVLEIVNSDTWPYDIEEVYGTNEAFEEKLMNVKTMFPSHVNDDNITKGCMVLLKLKEKTKKQEKN